MTSNFLCLNLKHHSENFIQMMSLYFSQAHLSLSYFLASGFCWYLALTFAASILPDCIQSSSQIICSLVFRSSVRPQTDFWNPVSFALSFTPSLPTEATPSLQCSCLWVLSDFSAPRSSLQVLPWPVAQYQLILLRGLLRLAYPEPVPFSLTLILYPSDICSSGLFPHCSFFVFLHWAASFNIPCVSSSKNIRNIRHTMSEIKISICRSNCISILSMSLFFLVAVSSNQPYGLPSSENYFNRYFIYITHLNFYNSLRSWLLCTGKVLEPANRRISIQRKWILLSLSHISLWCLKGNLQLFLKVHFMTWWPIVLLAVFALIHK